LNGITPKESFPGLCRLVLDKLSGLIILSSRDDSNALPVIFSIAYERIRNAVLEYIGVVKGAKTGAR